jgi:cytochrome c nitrite reductase small subunit
MRLVVPTAGQAVLEKLVSPSLNQKVFVDKIFQHGVNYEKMKNGYEHLLAGSKGMGRPLAGGGQTTPQYGSRRVLLLGVVLGFILMALCAWTYHYAGTSNFCGACHSMAGAVGQWKVSMHKQFKCIECHMPAAGISERVAYKAQAGMRDLFYEVSGNYPVFISLSGKGRVIVDGNCLRCHFSTVERTAMISEGEQCVKCHRYLVHGKGTNR